MIRVFTDSSGGKRIVGLGAVVVCDGSESAISTAFRPGCKTTDAELLAIFHSIDVIRALVRMKRVSARNNLVIFHCDCESIVRAINGVLTLKGSSRSLVKNLVEELDRMVGKELAGWSVKLIPRKENKADQEARKVRQTWLRRFKPRSSGPS